MVLAQTLKLAYIDGKVEKISHPLHCDSCVILSHYSDVLGTDHKPLQACTYEGSFSLLFHSFCSLIAFRTYMLHNSVLQVFPPLLPILWIRKHIRGWAVRWAISQLLPIVLHQGGPAHQLHGSELLKKIPRKKRKMVYLSNPTRRANASHSRLGKAVFLKKRKTTVQVEYRTSLHLEKKKGPVLWTGWKDVLRMLS